MHVNMPSSVRFVCEQLSARGHQAVIVGGCVRDVFLDREPHDWDVASSAMPEDVMATFPKVIPTGLQHGTVTVIIGDNAIEVTTFRSEGNYSDGRHPDCVCLGVTLEDDLSRRDFTMNAIAYDPTSQRVIDPFGGQMDISARVIRAVGNPYERFSEDALRIMRAFRFAAVLGFAVEPHTLDAAVVSVELLRKISAERIRDELFKLLTGVGASASLAAMSAVIDVILPELSPMRGMPQNHHHKYDVWGHTLAAVAAAPRDPVLRFAALLHDVGKPSTIKPHPTRPGEYQFLEHDDVGAKIADKICKRFKLTNDARALVVNMVQFHMGPTQMLNAGMSAVRRFIKKLGVEYVEPLLAICQADLIGTGGHHGEIEVIKQKFAEAMQGPVAVSAKQLAVSGKDIMDTFGLKPGPQVGGILKKLLEIVMDDPSLNDRDILLRIVAESLR